MILHQGKWRILQINGEELLSELVSNEDSHGLLQYHGIRLVYNCDVSFVRKSGFCWVSFLNPTYLETLSFIPCPLSFVRKSGFCWVSCPLSFVICRLSLVICPQIWVLLGFVPQPNLQICPLSFVPCPLSLAKDKHLSAQQIWVLLGFLSLIRKSTCPLSLVPCK